ncbi:MAG: RNA 2',3'-cyclic phosphodiesterase [Desulfotomaculaceae bacterium]|nr:RNA 2',3'-cyclic phosphodiesterase [Desulfotomaculaceae bacterium]MDD4766544.1 RNA 2',3'-cyclic phosphodiesterase [Desulfotomaculaceae bacterium]
MRLFVAVNFPFEIKKGIGSFIQDLRKIKSDLKWVEPENLHLTVQFLGNVSEDQVPAVTEALNRAAAGIASFTLKLSGVGVFPSRERPRVFWAGVAGDTVALLQLNSQMQGELKELGFAPGKNKFSPHLTLARLRTPAGFSDVMGRAEKTAENKVFGSARISTVDLMLSKLGSCGPQYYTLARAPLIGIQ